MRSSLCLSILASLVAATLSGCTGAMTQTPTLIAHRGNSSVAPENTLAAARSALAIGIPPEYVEIDLQRSKDGKIVVIHDATIDRTSDGKGEVAKMTLAEIRRHHAGYPKEFGDKFRGEPFPVLEEVLDTVKDTETGIMIEIKARGIGQIVAETVTRRGEADDHVIASFNAAAVVHANMTNPRIRTLYLSGSPSVQEVELCDRIGADIFGTSHKELTEPIIELAHKKGLVVWIWTVDEEDRVEQLVEWGADGIITNRPAVMRQLDAFGG